MRHTSVLSAFVRPGWRWAAVLLTLIALTGGSFHAAAAVGRAGKSQPQCQAASPTIPPTKQINIVLDDSGSMFAEGGKALDRWSFAKYSLEVFAALMEPQDTLNVYLTSSYINGQKPTTPVVTLRGSDESNSRVRQIHDMVLKGGGTPYEPVAQAAANLTASSADQKWLVILTDGRFQTDREVEIPTSTFRESLRGYTAADPSLKVVFMSMGAGAVTLSNEPGAGIYSYRAGTSQDVLARMKTLSSVIFQRVVATGVQSAWNPDVPLDQAVVFAQGEGVGIRQATTSAGTRSPDSVVTVQWKDNPDVEYDKRRVTAVPNTKLRGQLATFSDLPKGQMSFDISGSNAVVSVFYKPKVNFGIKLVDQTGKPIDANSSLIAGDYSVQYGFMDENCNIIESDLLGDVQYEATVTQDGKVVAQGLQPGETVPLESGAVSFDVRATYLNDQVSSARIKRSAKAVPSSTKIQGGSARYKASDLAEFPGPQDSLALQLSIKERREGSGPERPLTPEEWAAFDASAVEFEGSSNLEFKVTKTDQLGTILLSPRAPEGDIFAADTGKIEVFLVMPPLTEGNAESRSKASFEVVDDLNKWDRLMHWWRTVGWKVLLGLLAWLLLMGYIVKPRFDRDIEDQRTIEGRRNMGGGSTQITMAQFSVNGMSRLIPYKASTGTLFANLGSDGFQSFKLQAQRGKSVRLTNWEQIIEDATSRKWQVEVGGMPLEEGMHQAPVVSRGSQVAITTPGMSYGWNL